jgi:hypothetical protein
MATTQQLTPKADQPRVTTEELNRAERAGAGGKLQYKNTDVRVNPAKQAMRSMRAIKRT